MAVDGQVVTYECKDGHTYKIDHGKGKITKRLPAWWCKRMLTYWGKANGGTIVGRHSCPTCRRNDRKAAAGGAAVKRRLTEDK